MDESGFAYGTVVVDIVSIFASGVSSLLGMLHAGLRADTVGVAVASFISDLAHIAVDQKAISVQDPDSRVAYAVFQALLAGTPTIIFELDKEAGSRTETPARAPALAY